MSGLKRIILHLARDAQHPNGSSEHGYEFVAPLDGTNHIDAEQWKANRKLCSVRRFWAGEDDELGHLVHRAGGDGGSFWAFHYDIDHLEDDEAGYKFGSHAFELGEYVSLKDEDGVLNTFVVVSVEHA